jgi:hypothetical protein
MCGEPSTWDNSLIPAESPEVFLRLSDAQRVDVETTGILIYKGGAEAGFCCV